jgi:hypothetical protein
MDAFGSTINFGFVLDTDSMNVLLITGTIVSEPVFNLEPVKTVKKV